MVRVERGNVVLYVEENEVEHYLTLGYNVTDEEGNIIEESIPTNYDVLKGRYIEAKRKIEALESTIAELTAKAEVTEKKTTSRKKQVN